LRDDIDRFTAAGASVIAIAPESPAAIERFTKTHPVPFPIVSDADHATFDAYDVVSRAMSLGQRPAVFVVDAGGVVRFDAIGTQQWQIADNDTVLEILASLSSS
jgi:thioredoxin-dependent peroxiredoxin